MVCGWQTNCLLSIWPLCRGVKLSLFGRSWFHGQTIFLQLRGSPHLTAGLPPAFLRSSRLFFSSCAAFAVAASWSRRRSSLRSASSLAALASLSRLRDSRRSLAACRCSAFFAASCASTFGPQSEPRTSPATGSVPTIGGEENGFPMEQTGGQRCAGALYLEPDHLLLLGQTYGLLLSKQRSKGFSGQLLLLEVGSLRWATTLLQGLGIVLGRLVNAPCAGRGEGRPPLFVGRARVAGVVRVPAPRCLPFSCLQRVASFARNTAKGAVAPLPRRGGSGRTRRLGLPDASDDRWTRGGGQPFANCMGT